MDDYTGIRRVRPDRNRDGQRHARRCGGDRWGPRSARCTRRAQRSEEVIDPDAKLYSYSTKTTCLKDGTQSMFGLLTDMGNRPN